MRNMTSLIGRLNEKNRIRSLLQFLAIAAHPDQHLPHTGSQQSRLRDAELVMAIAASRDDPRPAVAAATVFDELDALINDIEAKQRGS